MAIENLALKETSENKIVAPAFRADFSEQDNKLLASLRAPSNPEYNLTVQSLPSITIENDPKVVADFISTTTHPQPADEYVKIGNHRYSNAAIAAAADSAGKDTTQDLQPQVKIKDDDAIEIITGGGSRSSLFNTRPQTRHHVVVPHVSPEVVPANPNDEPIKIIPYSGNGSRAHLFKNFEHRPEHSN